MRIDLDRRWRVRLSTAVDLPVAAENAWRQLKDFRRFACVDLFHRRVVLSEADPAAGVELEIFHGLVGVGFLRCGRILRWREGRGYEFSDLSRRHPLLGFPHIYGFELLPEGRNRCRLRVRVRGLWTARWIPRIGVKFWLALILLKIRLSASNLLLSRVLRDSSVDATV